MTKNTYTHVKPITEWKDQEVIKSRGENNKCNLISRMDPGLTRRR